MGNEQGDFKTKAVTLLSTSVDSSQQEIRLAFSGALDLASAGDGWNYRVQVNGEDVGVLTPFYNQIANEVVISAPSATLKAGDKLAVTYNLLDEQRKSLSGSTAALLVE